MATDHLQQANEKIRNAWNQCAAFWDGRMGDGNELVAVLVWPATERLLNLRAGERVLDIACGNGLSSRRLAAKGADVVAFDFAENMTARARARSHPPRRDPLSWGASFSEIPPVLVARMRLPAQ